MVNLSTSKGMQTKWYSDGTFHKLDLLGGEAVAEFLVSSLLRSSNFPVPYVVYGIGASGISESVSSDFSTRYSFTSFYRTLEMAFPRYKWFKPEYSLSRCFSTWESREWNTRSARERLELVADILSTVYLLPKPSVIFYLESLVALDSLVLNVDRHFNNFGVMFEHSTGRYLPALVFDNGMSLGVGCSDFLQAVNLRNVKLKPYTSSWSKYNSLSSVSFTIDVEMFVEILRAEFIYGFQFLSHSMQWRVLRHQLCKFIKTDCRGLSIDAYLSSVGL